MTTLQAAPSAEIPVIHLAIVSAALLTTLPTLLPHTRVRRPYPTLNSLLTIAHTVLLLSPLVLSCLTLARYPSELSSLHAPAARIHPILAILNASAAVAFNTTVDDDPPYLGLTDALLRPPAPSFATSIVAVAVVAVAVAVATSAVGAFFVVFARSHVQRRAGGVAALAALVWLLGSLAVAFLPGPIPKDTSPLVNKWFDHAYVDPDLLTQQRFLDNWWIRDPRRDSVTPVRDSPRFRPAFCRVFNALPVQRGLVIPDPAEDDPVLPVTAQPSTSIPDPDYSTTTITVSANEDEEDEEEQDEEEQDEEEQDEEEQDEDAQDEENDEDDIDDRPEVPPGEDDRPQPQERQQVPPSTTDTPSTDVNITGLPRLTEALLTDILIVYTVGKPLGEPYGRALSYTALPTLSLGPVAAAAALRGPSLWAFVAIWVGVVLVLFLFATPEILRPIAAPFHEADIIEFCGRRYSIFVTDPITRRRSIFDVVAFAVTGLVLVVQSFRWLRGRTAQAALLVEDGVADGATEKAGKGNRDPNADNDVDDISLEDVYTPPDPALALKW